MRRLLLRDSRHRWRRQSWNCYRLRYLMNWNCSTRNCRYWSCSIQNYHYWSWVSWAHWHPRNSEMMPRN